MAGFFIAAIDDGSDPESSAPGRGNLEHITGPHLGLSNMT
jgi:hypothetical protein